MTGTEQNQIRRQQDQAVVDALMSDDAARAIEILYRTVIHGIPVPDPDVVATLAVQPKRPARAWRRHTWIRSAVPLAIGLAAIIGSLGWSYSDYKERQDKWQKIAEEQSALASEQTAIAEERAVLLKDAEEFKEKAYAREARLMERRERQVARVRAALDAGEVLDAAVRISIRADELLIDGEPTKEDLESISAFVDELVGLAHNQAQQKESADLTPTGP